MEQIDWIRQKTNKALEIDMIRFMIVGGLGFIINLTVLYVVHGVSGLSIAISQIIGAETAILSNFYWHSRWTYKEAAEKPLPTRLLQFHASAWVGSGITSAVVIVLVKQFNVFYPAALVIGSLSGLLWNYLWTKHVIFKKSSQ